MEVMIILLMLCIFYIAVLRYEIDELLDRQGRHEGYIAWLKASVDYEKGKNK